MSPPRSFGKACAPPAARRAAGREVAGSAQDRAAATARPLLWYLVSDGRSVVEYAPELRPGLPIDIRLDGPTIAAQMRVGGDNALSVDVAEQDAASRRRTRRRRRPGRDVILGYFLRAIAGSAAAIFGQALGS